MPFGAKSSHSVQPPNNPTAIRAVAERHGLFVLEDAAQAHGTVYRGRSAGALGNAAAFSFYPGKNLGALGDAGAVVTGDAQIAARMRRLRNYGSDRKYVHEEIAGNSRLDEMQAACLRVKLRHLDRWNAVRRAAARRYIAKLADLPAIGLPLIAGDCVHSWHLYVVRVRDRDRDRVQAHLKAHGIDTLVHDPIPCHQQAAYAGRITADLALTERIADAVLSLPTGPHLADRDVDAVCAALADAVRDASPTGSSRL